MIIGTICARGGSKGIPHKNIRRLAGKPLITHTIQCARQCPVLERIIVSTDDQEIANIAKAAGAEVPFIQPAHLAQDDSSKWEVFRYLVENLEQPDKKPIDTLVDLDIGTPLRQPSDVTACIEKLLAGGGEAVMTAYAAERNPYFNMVELDKKGYAQMVKLTTPPIARRQAAPPVYSLSPAVLAVRRNALWNHEHWSQTKLQIHIIPRERALDIDDELDFRFVEHLINSREKNNV